MKAMIELLTRLHRHEHTARLSRQLTARESGVLRLKVALLRDTIPAPVLEHYDAIKSADAALDARAPILAMATLVETYLDLPASRQRKLESFFDIPGKRGSRRRPPLSGARRGLQVATQPQA
ncbi:MAG: hypothetical protein ACYDC1_15290 [Limisphaerales bacterium]